jgi:hypothetical protein
MFLLYNTLNYFVNGKSLYAAEMKPYKKLRGKIMGMLLVP